VADPPDGKSGQGESEGDEDRSLGPLKGPVTAGGLVDEVSQQMLGGEPGVALLMDIRMPETDGIEATRQITIDPPTSAVRVLILTTFELDEYVFAALRAGASGYLRACRPGLPGSCESGRLTASFRISHAGR
jgi:hypothetical protein